ncbi:unnamed protein product, partial [Scytosiphon promiscuus]
NVIQELHSQKVEFYNAGATGRIREIMFKSGIINSLHKEYLFVKIKEAVAYHDDPNTIPLLRERVAHQNQSN